MAVLYDLGLVKGRAAKWHSGTALTGTGSNLSATVDGCIVEDMYINTETKEVYRAIAANKWEYVCTLEGKQGPMGPVGEMRVVVNEDNYSILGELVCNTEYRCVSTSPTKAPSFTIPALAGTDAVFQAAVVFVAPNTTAPVITNNSGYPLKYKGKGIVNNVWTPEVGTVYRMSIAFDGIFLNCYVTGVV